MKVPAMDLAMKLPIKVSTATSNFMIGVTAAASAGVYFARGDINPYIAGPVAAGVMIGATAGSRLLGRLKNNLIRTLFVIVLIVVSIQMLLKGLRSEHLLHRSDNDVEYLPGWCDEVHRRFEANPRLGQLELRTLGEEGINPNVGGNCVVRSSVFGQVRWEEQAWQPGRATEDYYYTQAVQAAGYDWERVLKPCIVHHGIGTPQTDPYYAETWRAKGWGGY
jgi:hypothetical protein